MTIILVVVFVVQIVK